MADLLGSSPIGSTTPRKQTKRAGTGLVVVQLLFFWLHTYRELLLASRGLVRKKEKRRGFGTTTLPWCPIERPDRKITQPKKSTQKMQIKNHRFINSLRLATLATYHALGALVLCGDLLFMLRGNSITCSLVTIFYLC